MNKYISKLALAFFLIVASACSDDESIVPVDAQGNEIDPFDLSLVNLSVSSDEVEDYSVVVNIESDNFGRAFYIVQPSSLSSPDSRTVVDDGTSIDVDQEESISIEIKELESNTDYTVYFATLNGVNERNPAVFEVSFTTPDSFDPVFFGESSSPSQGSENNDPFSTMVTLNFSETVFYTGETITFTGFFSGNSYEVNSEDLVMDGSNEVVIDVPTEFFAQDDAIVVNFEEGTFVDQAGKSVAALTDTNFFFFTGAYTVQQIVETFFDAERYSLSAETDLNVPIEPDGTEFDTMAFLNEDGEYQINLRNAVDAATGNSFNNFEVIFQEDGLDGNLDGIGYLFLKGIPVESVYTSGGTQLYWSPYFNSQSSQIIVGQYDLSTGIIEINVALTTLNGPDETFFGSVDYTYSPVLEDDED